MTGLERGYRWLLLAYPAWYRRDRGDEMLDTLLAAAPDGRTWLSPRDAGALILGGLRVRAGLDRRLPTATSLRLAVLLGVALWLAERASGSMTVASLAWLRWMSTAPSGWTWYALSSGLLVLATVSTAWLAPRPVTVVVALGVAVVCAYQDWDGSWWSLLGLPAMLVALATLAWGRERMPWSWLLLLGTAFAVTPVNFFTGMGRSPLHFLSPVASYLPWAIIVAVVLWAVVDARPAIAVGVTTMLDRAVPFATHWYDTSFGTNLSWFLPLAIGAALVLVMGLRLRRQAVL